MWSSPLPPFRLSRRVSEHARGPAFFFHGVPVPSASASRPGAAAVRPLLPPSPLARSSSPAPPVPGLSRPRPEGQGSPRPPRRCASLSRVCRGGPPRPHTRPRASAARGRRPGTSAWSVGAVCRAGARAVWRRLGGSRRVASPGSVHPPPSSRSVPLVRPRPVVVRSLSPSGGVVGISGGRFPSVPTGDRRPAGVLSSLPPARPPGLSVLIIIPALRSLARSVLSASLDGRPSIRPMMPARAPTWLILPVAYACLKD